MANLETTKTVYLVLIQGNNPNTALKHRICSKAGIMFVTFSWCSAAVETSTTGRALNQVASQLVQLLHALEKTGTAAAILRRSADGTLAHPTCNPKGTAAEHFHWDDWVKLCCLQQLIAHNMAKAQNLHAYGIAWHENSKL